MNKGNASVKSSLEEEIAIVKSGLQEKIATVKLSFEWRIVNVDSNLGAEIWLNK